MWVRVMETSPGITMTPSQKSVLCFTLVAVKGMITTLTHWQIVRMNATSKPFKHVLKYDVHQTAQLSWVKMDVQYAVVPIASMTVCGMYMAVPGPQMIVRAVVARMENHCAMLRSVPVHNVLTPVT